MTAALQMLCGGATLLLLALPSGEFRAVHSGAVSIQSASALLYLIVFGSWIGFSAYVWILKSEQAGARGDLRLCRTR